MKEKRNYRDNRYGKIYIIARQKRNKDFVW